MTARRGATNGSGTVLTQTSPSDVLATLELSQRVGRFTWWVRATGNSGTANIHFVDHEGVEDSDAFMSKTFTADSRIALDGDFRAPETVIRITPDSITSMTVKVEGIGY